MKHFISALQFLTILPLGKPRDLDAPKIIPYFPVVGLTIGFLLVLGDYVFSMLWPVTIVSFLDVLLLAILSGGLHLDGLGDTADGFLSHRSPERVLTIMRDSRIGVMGLLAIVFILAIKWCGINSLENHRALYLFIIPAYSRGAMMFGIKFLRYGRPQGGMGTDFFSDKPPIYALSIILLPVFFSFWLRLDGPMIRGHGGNIYDLARNIGCPPDEIIDMSSNTNPLGPAPGLLEYLKENLSAINVHPEVDSKTLLEAFASHHKIRADRVLAGNGTTQFIYTLPLALGTKKALILGPTYTDYGDTCQMYKIDCEYMMAEESDLFQPNIMDIRAYLVDIDTVFICNPNNPIGNLIARKDLIKLCEAYPGTRFLIDESYLPFTGQHDETTVIQTDLSNVMVLHSFTHSQKFLGYRD
jgi:cobalamin 5'-phosphate synthase/cobalamin synthase